MRRVYSFALLIAGLVACKEPAPTEPTPPAFAPDRACPGGEGCASHQGPLLVGASAQRITPTGFEIVRAVYLKNDRPDRCEAGLPRGGETRCGKVKDNAFDDCGSDGVCVADEGYTGPDIDGTEGDGKPDWFHDCGRDRICPPPFDTPELGELGENGIDDDGDGAVDEQPWNAPDPDGSEGDGLFQGLWIGGYQPSRPVMGIKDDLWARALVLSQGDVTVAIVVIDTVGLFLREVDRIRSLVEEARPGAVDLIIVQSTHTHEGPDTLGQWGLEDPYAGLPLHHGRDDLHMERLRQALRDAVLQAIDTLSPATVFAGAINTRIDGLLYDARDPAIFEDTMTALRFVREDGSTIATFAHWASHPESLDNRNNYLSSDFPHAMRNALEQGLPATSLYPAHAGLGGVAIYSQGALGGQIGQNGIEITARDGTVFEKRNRSFARTDAYGEMVAEQAFLALEAGGEVEGTGLRFSMKRYLAPVDNKAYHLGWFAGWFDRDFLDWDENAPLGDDNRPHIEMEVDLVAVGPLVFLTAPGELHPEAWVGYEEELSLGQPYIRADNPNPPPVENAPTDPPLKARVEGRFPMLLGLAQDESGYLIPPYNFELHEGAPWIEEAPGDHYEETNSIGIEALPRYLEVAHGLLEHTQSASP